MIIAGVFVMLTLAVPLRALIQERREIKDLEQQVVSQQAKIDELKNRQERLSDPAYLQAIAR